MSAHDGLVGIVAQGDAYLVDATRQLELVKDSIEEAMSRYASVSQGRSTSLSTANAKLGEAINSIAAIHACINIAVEHTGSWMGRLVE
jgi:hypothetical protein